MYSEEFQNKKFYGDREKMTAVFRIANQELEKIRNGKKRLEENKENLAPDDLKKILTDMEGMKSAFIEGITNNSSGQVRQAIEFLRQYAGSSDVAEFKKEILIAIDDYIKILKDELSKQGVEINSVEKNPDELFQKKIEKEIRSWRTSIEDDKEYAETLDEDELKEFAERKKIYTTSVEDDWENAPDDIKKTVESIKNKVGTDESIEARRVYVSLLHELNEYLQGLMDEGDRILSKDEIKNVLKEELEKKAKKEEARNEVEVQINDFLKKTR
mgnify:CR=1 FL=1